MRLTLTHFEYWQSKQRKPKWAEGFKNNPQVVTNIDKVINAHGNWKPSGHHNTHNTVSLMRSVRKSLQDGLYLPQSKNLCDYFGRTQESEKRRRSLFTKWHKRLLKEQQNYKGRHYD